MKEILTALCLLLGFSLTVHADNNTFTVLQLNTWNEGNPVKGGYEAMADEIARLKPDFVTISEVANLFDTHFSDRIVKSLAERGETYYSFYSYCSGLLSRHAIIDSCKGAPIHHNRGTIFRMLTQINGQEIAIYSAHIDYQYYACYNARGYDGTTCKKIPRPETVNEILKVNDTSSRDDAIRNFINYSKEDISKGRIVILGGDFNEPSHLDWIRETKDLYDHNGFIIPWTSTLLLDNAGFKDSYRVLYPDVLKYPGFTFPSDNENKKVTEITWLPTADERDRIDYVFYYPHPKLQLKKAALLGPSKSIARGQRVEEKSNDKFIEPSGIWFTDHKGLLVQFKLKK